MVNDLLISSDDIQLFSLGVDGGLDVLFSDGDLTGNIDGDLLVDYFLVNNGFFGLFFGIYWSGYNLLSDDGSLDNSLLDDGLRNNLLGDDWLRDDFSGDGWFGDDLLSLGDDRFRVKNLSSNHLLLSLTSLLSSHTLNKLSSRCSHQLSIHRPIHRSIH